MLLWGIGQPMPLLHWKEHMKIRIDEVGYDQYTGRLGLVDFVDGVSVNDVSSGELNRMSAIIRVVDADTMGQVGALTEYTDNAEVAFLPEAKLEEGMSFVEPNTNIPQTTAEEYTLEQLEALADKEGINGLRAIAEPLNVKDTSIKGLIGGILSKISK